MSDRREQEQGEIGCPTVVPDIDCPVQIRPLIQRHPATFLPAAFALLLLLGTAACGTPRGGTRLPQVALRLSDLPPGMERVSGRAWTDTQAAQREGVSVALLREHGWLSSFTNRFDRNPADSTARIFIQRAGSEVTVFRTPQGATWGYRRARKAAGRAYLWGATTLGTNAGQARVRVPFQRARAPDVGQARTAFTAIAGGDEFAYTTDVVVFREGRYVASASMTALTETAARHYAVRAARRMDARMGAGR